MPVYIMLTTLTAQGVQTLKANPERLREVNRDVEELGAKVLHQWATLGPFDFVNVVEAPDAATIARVSVALGARGSAKLQTLTALEIEEFIDRAGLAGCRRPRPRRRAAAFASDQLAVRPRACARRCARAGTRGRTASPPAA